MARQRPTVQDLGSSGLTPAARIADRYFRPNLAQPELRSLTDFGPLSTSLQKLVATWVNEHGEAEFEKGESYFQLNPSKAEDVMRQAQGAETPEEAQKRLQSAFGELVRTGQLHEAGSPLFQRGFAIAAARSVVGEYRNRLLARIPETTVLTDPEDADLPANAADPQQLIDEEWAKVADNIALQNYYGRTLAGKLKQGVDLEFSHNSAAARADAIADQHKTYLADNIAEQFDTLRAQGLDAGDADLARIEKFVSERVHGANVKDPRAVVWRGLKLHLARTANQYGPEEALRMLDMAADLRVGNLELGKDSGVGLAIQDEKDRLMRQAREEESRELSERPARERDARVKGGGLYLDLLNDAFKNGTSLLAARDQAEALIAGSDIPPEFKPIVRDDLFDKVNSMQSRAGSDQDLLTRIYTELAHGRAGEANTLYEAGLKDGKIVGPDVLDIDGKITAASAITPKMDNSASYQATVGAIRQAPNLDGFAPEVQDKIDTLRVNLEEGYRAARVALIEQTNGQPDQDAKLNEFDRAQATAIGEQLRSVVKEQRTKYDTFVGKFSELAARKLDARQVIDEALNSGAITRQQAEALRIKNNETSDRTSWYALPDVDRALKNIAAEIAGAEKLGDETVRLQLQGVFARRYQDLWNKYLDENLPKTEPRSIPGLLREAARFAEDEVMKAVGAGIRVETQKRVEAGASGEEAGKATTEVINSQTAADNWALQVDSNPAAFSANNQNLLVKAGVNAPVDVLEAYADLIKTELDDTVFMSSGPFSWWSVNAHGRAMDRLGEGAFEILDSVDIKDTEKPTAVAQLLSLGVLTADDLLNDKVVVRRGEEIRNRALGEYARRDRTVQAVTGNPKKQGYRGDLDEFLREQEVSLAGVKIDPYTTPLWRSLSDMQRFAQERPADLTKLLTRLGIPTDKPNVQTFIDYQKDAIRRVHKQ